MNALEADMRKRIISLAEEDYDCVVIDGKHRWEIDEDEELEEDE